MRADERHALQAGTLISKRQTRKAIGAKRQVAPAGLVDSGSALPKQHAVGNVQAAQESTAKPPKPPSEKSSPPSEKATPNASPSSSRKSLS